MIPEERRTDSKLKGALALGVRIDTKWLIGTIGAILLNAGMMYQQFTDMKESVKDLRTSVSSLATVDYTQTRQDKTLTDHELRIRQLERERKNNGNSR